MKKIILVGALMLLVSAGCSFHKKSAEVKNEDKPNNQTQTIQKGDQPDYTPEKGKKLYVDSANGFQFTYPDYMKIGLNSPNSVLGDADHKVSGLYVGNYVFVTVSDKNGLWAAANTYFHSFYDEAFSTEKELKDFFDNAEGPTAACLKTSYKNNNGLTILGIDCGGEGGSARYIYIQGKDEDIFVDGYSRGYITSGKEQDAYDQNVVDFKTDQEFSDTLASFKFTK